MKKQNVPKRRKGSAGMIGMGRGDLKQGGGTITRKLPSVEAVQDRRDRIGAKSVKVERSAAAFGARARAAKTNISDERS